jgi:hypothetical protein
MTELEQKSFGQFSSHMTQRPTKLGPVKIILDTQEDTEGKEHTLDLDSNGIKIKRTGMYLVIAGLQVCKSIGDEPRWIDFWVRVNDKDLRNSNVRYVIKDHPTKDVIVNQILAHLYSGDILNIMMSTEVADEGLGIETISPEGEPSIPSIILTVIQL